MDKRLREPPAFLVGVAYVAIMTIWIYTVFDVPGRAGRLLPVWIPLLIVVHLLVGFRLATWRTALLALALPVVGGPAGTYPGTETPASFFLLVFVVPPAAALLALGAGARKALRALARPRADGTPRRTK